MHIVFLPSRDPLLFAITKFCYSLICYSLITKFMKKIAKAIVLDN